VRHVRREKPLILPDALAAGDAIGYVGARMATEEGLGFKYTFSGSVYFDRMKAKGLYCIDGDEIRRKVERAGMTAIFS